MPKSAKSKPASLLSSNKRFSGPTAIIAAVALVVIGVIVIAKTFAYTTTAFPYETPRYPNCPYNQHIVNITAGRRMFYYHPTVQNGSTGQCVVKLQRLINRWRGYKILDDDGKFGPQTLGQVKAFQKIYTPAVVDGIVGKATWGWLYYTVNCSPTLCPLITIQ